MDLLRSLHKQLVVFYAKNKAAALWFSAGILLFLALQFGSELLGLLLAPFTLLFRARKVAKAAEVLGVLDSLKEEQAAFEDDIEETQMDAAQVREDAERSADEWLDR